MSRPRGRATRESSSDVTLKIPRPLYEQLAQLLDESGYRSVTELSVSVLRQLVAERTARTNGGGSSAVDVEVLDADITELRVDAVVNAANDHLWMGAGVAGAIKRAGGDEIEREALALAPIAVGDAVVTTAGRLPAKHVIHGAVMGQDLRTTPEIISATTRRCLEVADELGAESVALPAFGTGVGGVAVPEAAAAIAAGIDQVELESVRRIVIAVFGRRAVDAFRRALAARRSA